MWTKKGLYNNNTHIIFETDTLPYCFNFPNESSKQIDHITVDTFTTIPFSDLNNFEGKAVCGIYKYELNYMYIKLPLSELETLDEVGLSKYLRENK